MARIVRTVLARLGAVAASLLCLLILCFGLFRVLPGDPVAQLTRQRQVTADERAYLRHSLGLDRSLPQRFGQYLDDVAHGDLGVSYQYRQPVRQMIAARLWPTVLLVGASLVIAVALGMWTGALAGWRSRSTFDAIATNTALALWSTPVFWLGLLLLMLLGAGAGPLPALFPLGGMRTPGTQWSVLDVARHLVLPCLTLVLAQYGQYALTMRSSVLAEKAAHYVIVARAKGLRDAAVRRRHVTPNALLPTLTQAFMQLGFVVSGAITVETVYSWPGLGYLTFEALRIPDLPLLQGTFLVLCCTVILTNAAADLLYRLVDPRVRPR